MINYRATLLVVLSSLLLLCACSPKTTVQEGIPPGILSKDSFAVLLRDFALAESAANMNVKNISLSAMDSVYAFDPLVEHGISKSQYDSTLRYYIDHPALYKEVYALVLEDLSKMESGHSGAKKDSLVVTH